MPSKNQNISFENSMNKRANEVIWKTNTTYTIENFNLRQKHPKIQVNNLYWEAVDDSDGPYLKLIGYSKPGADGQDEYVKTKEAKLPSHVRSVKSERIKARLMYINDIYHLSKEDAFELKKTAVIIHPLTAINKSLLQASEENDAKNPLIQHAYPPMEIKFKEASLSSSQTIQPEVTINNNQTIQQENFVELKTNTIYTTKIFNRHYKTNKVHNLYWEVAEDDSSNCRYLKLVGYSVPGANEQDEYIQTNDSILPFRWVRKKIKARLREINRQLPATSAFKLEREKVIIYPLTVINSSHLNLEECVAQNNLIHPSIAHANPDNNIMEEQIMNNNQGNENINEVAWKTNMSYTIEDFNLRQKHPKAQVIKMYWEAVEDPKEPYLKLIGYTVPGPNKQEVYVPTEDSILPFPSVKNERIRDRLTRINKDYQLSDINAFKLKKEKVVIYPLTMSNHFCIKGIPEDPVITAFLNVKGNEESQAETASPVEEETRPVDGVHTTSLISNSEQAQTEPPSSPPTKINRSGSMTDISRITVSSLLNRDRENFAAPVLEETNNVQSSGLKKARI